MRSPVGSERFRRRRGRIGPFVIRHGVPEDDVQAYAWFSIIAARKLRDAKKNKDIVKKRMTPAQIAEAQKLSSEYWEKYVLPFQKD